MGDQELWNRAMHLLQVRGIRRRATPDEWKLIAEMSYDFHRAVRYQMERDLKIYPLFDALRCGYSLRRALPNTSPE